MNFFADEGLDFPLVKLLCEAGYNIVYAAEEYIGATDNELLQKAFADNRVLITKDKDFGELVIRLKYPTAGIILIRVDQLNRTSNSLLVLNAIKKYEAD